MSVGDPKLPLPDPERLLSLEPRVCVWQENRPLFRIYFQAGVHPSAWNRFRHYGPLATGRFDPHVAPARLQARGVLYAAEVIPTCLAEVFQDTRVVDLMARTPHLAAFRPTRPLQLLDLQGRWITRAGASGAISTGNRETARAWARSIYETYPSLDGLLYRSSMDPVSTAVALFERSADAVPPRALLDLPLGARAIRRDVQAACEALGYQLAE